MIVILYFQQLPLKDFSYRKDHKVAELSLIWKSDDKHTEEVKQVITIFTEINCILLSDPEAGPLKFKVCVCNI